MPNIGFCSWSFIIKPQEMSEPNKSGQYDCSVLLDRPELQFLSLRLLSKKKSRKSHDLFLALEHPALGLKFKQACTDIGLSVLEPCFYMFRHGGASHDKVTGFRSLPEIQKRCQWLSPASERRYEKHARMQHQLS